MGKGILEDRRLAFEESFFAARSERLRELRSDAAGAEIRERLAAIAGIRDAEVLERLVSLDVRPETWIALTLVPLIAVAWADGRIDVEERDAILAAAESDGVLRDSPAHTMLESWLAHRPGNELLGSWGTLAMALCQQFAEPERKVLETEVMGRALRVAEAAGDYFGVGDNVSDVERAVMARLQNAFQ